MLCVAKCGNMPHMMKSVRISEQLYTSADKEAAVMHRSTAAQLEFWASIGRKAEALLDVNTLQALLHATMVDEAQASSLKNNQKLADLIRKGQLSKESVRFFSKEMVKNSVVDFTGADF